ncbi:hypothetical protein RFI_17029 [Reticulomyxa filosa]|uniref:Glutaredoxin domain-containing protein n=1 Tax=Reticulomyxa filosa TaxID=46433 RepID=X6N362_RETFI|nr:hypothetical protein RFI_17029 [Reticulomyxa filosa]|eukprot:ETO20189.1 hypothetical protein RFI_17029 [Reticulomyxa filosa]
MSIKIFGKSNTQIFGKCKLPRLAWSQRCYITVGHRLGMKTRPCAVLFRADIFKNSHQSFSAQPSSTDLTEVKKEIAKEVKENPIFLYMKGTPDAPMCGFSKNVVMILNAMEVNFKSRNILQYPEFRVAVKEYSNFPTFPQLYVGGELVGGNDIVVEMFKSGELEQLFDKATKDSNKSDQK